MLKKGKRTSDKSVPPDGALPLRRGSTDHFVAQVLKEEAGFKRYVKASFLSGGCLLGGTSLPEFFPKADFQDGCETWGWTPDFWVVGCGRNGSFFTRDVLAVTEHWPTHTHTSACPSLQVWSITLVPSIQVRCRWVWLNSSGFLPGRSLLLFICWRQSQNQDGFSLV